MTPTTQAKLLRVLQERTFRPLGGVREQSVDIRVIAATNVEPLEAVRQGKLREDLYYRLNVFNIRLPPLRDRKDDIPLLVQAFIREFNARNSRSVAGLTDAAMHVIERYDWPGNVRELRNVMERSTIVAKGALIDVAELPPLANPPAAPRAAAGGLIARHDRGRGRAAAHRGHAATHRRQQDARRRDARHQPQDAAQQAQPHEGRSGSLTAHAPEHQDQTGRRRHRRRGAGGRVPVGVVPRLARFRTAQGKPRQSGRVE